MTDEEKYELARINVIGTILSLSDEQNKNLIAEIRKELGMKIKYEQGPGQ